MPTLIRPQAKFLQLPHKFRAYVGGFGSGKTWVGSTAMCQGFWKYPKINQGYFAPTFPQIRDIFYPTITEVSETMGLNVKISEGNKEAHFYEGKKYRGTTICRSMSKPESIVGFKIGNALVDELDIMAVNKARQAWQKIIARMRYQTVGELRNGIDVTTTPEGFRFVYDQFFVQPHKSKEAKKMYGLVQSSTYENETHLPFDYIPSLLASYPSQLVEAYLNGQFVNLTSGSVYKEFDRKLNHTDEIVIISATMKEPLHIGMDFNVGKMCAIVHVMRGQDPHAVDEMTGVFDTPAMIQSIKRRYLGHPIIVYPDASGNSRKTNDASVSDISLLRTAGFQVMGEASNPFVRDRVLAMNAMICTNNVRRYKVNSDKCPMLVETLEKQVYDKNGEPDKTSGLDHPGDATGYFIAYKFPIAPQAMQHMKLMGV